MVSEVANDTSQVQQPNTAMVPEAEDDTNQQNTAMVPEAEDDTNQLNTAMVPEAEDDTNQVQQHKPAVVPGGENNDLLRNKATMKDRSKVWKFIKVYTNNASFKWQKNAFALFII